MKEQCDEHGCKELLCGCPTVALEDNGNFSEMIKAKDKWINELIDSEEKLKQLLDLAMGTVNYYAGLTQPLNGDDNTQVEGTEDMDNYYERGGKRARETREEITKQLKEL